MIVFAIVAAVASLVLCGTALVLLLRADATRPRRATFRP